MCRRTVTIVHKEARHDHEAATRGPSLAVHHHHHVGHDHFAIYRNRTCSAERSRPSWRFRGKNAALGGDGPTSSCSRGSEAHALFAWFGFTEYKQMVGPLRPPRSRQEQLIDQVGAESSKPAELGAALQAQKSELDRYVRAEL